MSAWQGQQQQHPFPSQSWQHQQQQQGGSWADPRLSTPNPYQQPPPPAQTPVSPIQPYNPAGAHNTAQWGVKYNHGQLPAFGNESKPPLPPRPVSALSNSPALGTPVAATPSWQTSTWNSTPSAPPSAPQSNTVPDARYNVAPPWPQVSHPVPPIHSSHSPATHTPLSPHYQASPQVSSSQYPVQSQATHSQYQPNPSYHAGPMPPPPPLPPPSPNIGLPPPPPRPSAYQSQSQLSQQASQQGWQDSPAQHAPPTQVQSSYSHDDPVRRATPLSQPWSRVDPQAPVSPEIAPAVPWKTSHTPPIPTQDKITGSSVLGGGGPSDWEHFQATDASGGDDVLTPIRSNKSSKTSVHQQYAELPAATHNREARDFNSAHDVRPARDHSVSPELKPQPPKRTGTIDGVIQAWSTDQVDYSRKSSVSTLDRSRKDAPPSPKASPGLGMQQTHATEHKASETEYADEPERPSLRNRDSIRHNSYPRPPPAPKLIEVDPYADLNMESKASLARFVTMLRKEEAAPEDEKYKVFKAFVVKENRLRSVLYGVEPEDFILPNPVANPTPVYSANSVPVRANTTKESAGKVAPGRPLTVDTSPGSNEESYVVVEREEEAEYSPGGRPRVRRPDAEYSPGGRPFAVRPEGEYSPGGRPRATKVDAEYSPGGRPRVSIPARRSTLSHAPPKPAPVESPSDYAPIVVDESTAPGVGLRLPLVQDPVSRSGTAPLAMRNAVVEEPIKFEPARPAYTPFKYEQGPQQASENLTVTRPPSQAYSALRLQSEGSGRLMTQSTAGLSSPVPSKAPASPASTLAPKEHEEAFMGLIREQSRVYRSGRQGSVPGPFGIKKAASPEPVDRQADTQNALRKLIPTTMPQNRPKSSITDRIRTEMGDCPDVFTWIPEIVVAWDRENRVVRVKQDEERHRRQEESENRIDELFNDHQIGYSDIGQLEADYKLAEATKQYEEDVEGLQSFTDQVFSPVADRLREEIGLLNAQYLRAVETLEKDAESGRQYIYESGDRASHRASRTEVVEVVLDLYKKLQIRHQKVAEAEHERERRRKVLEMSVLRTNGDIAGMKRLEQEFTSAERKQSLLEARAKDSRANKLMDTLDRAVVRGLGDNQQLVDETVKKLQNLTSWLDAKPTLQDETLADLQNTLRSIEEVLDFVANDSQALLILSTTADDLLNTADYEVSKAEARLANTSPENMKKLEEEKSKEDERIKAEVDTRMGSVAKGPAHALTMLRNTVKRLADDPEHQDRVHRALEAAKLRNAARTPAA